MDKLENLRVQIDEIDDKLIQLLNQRAAISKKIGNLKLTQNEPIMQQNREKTVLNHVKSLAQEITPLGAEMIWKEVISACRQVQGESNKIGYLGPQGTFTHMAALDFFPKRIPEFIPFDHTHEIFSQIEGNYLNFGIVPVENSLQGSVSDTLDLLIERNIPIYGEIELRINQNLIGLAGAKLSQLKTIYSHPQALAQTSSWIKKNIPQVELVEMSSTVKAIMKVADMKDPAIAAIGTKLAAEIYHLEILAPGIEDDTQNYTRFLIISKNKVNATSTDKTSMVFVVKHIPGALFNVLRLFADAKINLAKIESRPRKIGKDSVWEYIFVLDFDEHVDNVKGVIDQVNNQSIYMKILGSYPRNPRRFN